MSNQYRYQQNLLEKSPILMNVEYKRSKVEKMLSVLRDAGVLDAGGVAADVGCSVGFFCKALAPWFDTVHGLDIDSGAISIARENAPKNVLFDVADSMELPFQDCSLSLVVCNHVYEHVPDAERLFDEIRRVLKPGGVCYLGAASRFTIVEPHYHLPFLSWLPKFIAHRYMRLFGKGNEYYENLHTYWGIRQLIRKFEVDDYTLKILGDPDRFCARDLIPQESLVSRIPLSVWRLAYPFLPSYIFLLKKAG